MDKNTSNHIQHPLSARIQFDWVDVFRVIAMLIIVNGHLLAWEYVIENFAGLTCVSFFFFVAALFDKIQTPAAFRIRLTKLIVPYTIYNYLMLILLQYSSLAYKYDISRWQTWIDVLISPVNFALWFLAVLIILSLIAPILRLLPRYLLGAITIASFISIYYLKAEGYSSDIWNNGILLYIGGLAWFSAGLFVRRFLTMQELTQILYNKLWVLLLIIIILLTISHTCYDHHSELFLFSSAISVPTLAIAISKYLPRLTCFILTFSPAIFFIYVSHPFFTRIWGKLYLTLADQGYTLLAIILKQTGGTLIFIACYFIFCALRRFPNFKMLSLSN